MKKSYVMVTIIAAVITIVASLIGLACIAEANSNLIPELIMEKPENEGYDEYELHMNMYCSLPDYGAVIIKIAVSRDDTEPYGNSGKCSAYSRDGEYIDSIGGNIVVDFSNCENVDDMKDAIADYVAGYNFSDDAEKGTFYEKIYIW